MKDDLGYPIAGWEELLDRANTAAAQLQEIKDAKAQMAGEFQQEALRLHAQLSEQRATIERLEQENGQLRDEVAMYRHLTPNTRRMP